MNESTASAAPSTSLTTEVPLEVVADRITPLVLRGEFTGETGLRLQILGNFSFRNLVGKQAYKDHLLRLRTPSALKTAGTIESQPGARIGRARAVIGNILLKK